MIFFRILLTGMFLGITAYTAIASQSYGWDLLTPFFQGLISLTWPGQFHFDFSCYLLLSGLWIMWRNQFSPQSIALGLVASVLGILFFAPYLIWLSFQNSGNIKGILLGKNQST
ncbi:hypothetical protein LPTSP4_27730 [Leptospira ryugenii]|uniref:DUF2834 domain-containing protein n=1 Tax=Leptospira ryugenii TaxID=1917863 RepID=A0A2P2E2Z8_9LEPT|nr:hypothetical protein [Leptospira ryugenii]GBF51241.1 hypothetical protein LPTSP4_27730 [Leptospira ryugenii]